MPLREVLPNTFILVADDSPAEVGIVPEAKGDKRPIHLIQYELLTENPYTLTHEDLTYEVFVQRQGFMSEELETRGSEICTELLSKEHPCLRASSLTKRYGWGAHYDENGKIALYSMDSAEYVRLAEMDERAGKVILAMRSKRK